MRAKALRFPDLKFVPEPDEGHRVLDAGVGFQFVAQNDPAFAVDLQGLARAVERDQKFFALVRVGRIAPDQALDVREQRIAAGIDRRLVERWIAVEPLEPVAHEHPPEGCRNRHPTLGIEPQRVVRHEAVHPHSTPGYAPVSTPLSPTNGRSQRWLHRLGLNGITWDNMGVNGRAVVGPTRPNLRLINELAAIRLK